MRAQIYKAVLSQAILLMTKEKLTVYTAILIMAIKRLLSGAPTASR